MSWYLYDFANSFVYINVTLYFSQWVVIDQGFSDIAFSLPFIISTVILILTSSLVGNHGDQKGTHGIIFLYATLVTFASFIGIFFAGRFLPHPIGPLLALFFFGLYQLGYLLSFVPYNTFTKYISPSRFYGAVSGIGLGFSEVGHIAGLLLTLPITQGAWVFFGTDRLAPLVPAFFAFLLFALPALIVFSKKQFMPTPGRSTAHWWQIFWRHLMESRIIPGLFPLILAFYFFSDALQTVSLYSAIYLEQVFGAPDATKVVMFILVLVGFTIGSLASGGLCDRIGHRKVLVFFLTLSGVAIIALAAANSISLLYPTFIIFGIAAGGVYASSRSYLASLVSQEESGKFFGLYTFAERFASVIGPALWGIVILLFSSVTPLNYRIAATLMGLIALLGIIPLYRRTKKSTLNV